MGTSTNNRDPHRLATVVGGLVLLVCGGAAAFFVGTYHPTWPGYLYAPAFAIIGAWLCANSVRSSDYEFVAVAFPLVAAICIEVHTQPTAILAMLLSGLASFAIVCATLGGGVLAIAYDE